MYQISKQSTIGELVTERPSRSIFFEKLNIDYCCGGKKSIEEVCIEKKLPLEQVLQQLEQFDHSNTHAEEKDWSQETLPELVKNLLDTHHVYTKTALERLSHLLDKVVQSHSQKHPSLLQLKIEFHTLKTDLESHMQKEELVLFPYCLQLETAETMPQFHCGTILNPINVMIREHEDVGLILAKMRTLTQDYTPPEDACNTYRVLLDGLQEFEADLHLHIHKENNILFPLALKFSQSLLIKSCACS